MKGTILILKTPGRDFFEVIWWLRCGYSQFEVLICYSSPTARRLSTFLCLQTLSTKNPKQQDPEMLTSMEWRKWHLHLLHMLPPRFAWCLLPSTRHKASYYFLRFTLPWVVLLSSPSLWPQIRSTFTCLFLTCWKGKKSRKIGRLWNSGGTSKLSYFNLGLA